MHEVRRDRNRRNVFSRQCFASGVPNENKTSPIHPPPDERKMRTNLVINKGAELAPTRGSETPTKGKRELGAQLNGAQDVQKKANMEMTILSTRKLSFVSVEAERNCG